MVADVLINVDVKAELERRGITYKLENADEISVLCPFHADTNPSCQISLSKRVFRCWSAACSQTGDLVTFLAAISRVTRNDILADLSTRYVLSKTPTKIVDVKVVEDYHKSIWTAKDLVKELYARGVTDALIRKYRLGEHDGRIVIPIKDELGYYVNLRLYLPGAPTKQKMKSIRGFGKQLRLYPIEQLEYDKIVICGGEMKAIVAAEQLNKHGIGAITTTGGESKSGWSNEVAMRFKGKKRLWFCYDIDDGGKAGSHHGAVSCSELVEWLGVVKLPLDIKKYPKGDINDFVAKEGGDLFEVINNTPQWEMPKIPIPYSDVPLPTVSNLLDVVDAKSTGQRVVLKASVTAIDVTPYILPQKICVSCDRQQPFCGLCQVSASRETEFIIPSESPFLLEMINKKETVQRSACMKALGVPVLCESYSQEILSHVNAEEIELSPVLELTTEIADQTAPVPAICIGKNLDLNGNYTFTGRMYPHPDTQKATLLLSEREATQDSLSTYQPTPENLEDMRIFTPAEWSVAGLQKKLDEIYEDLETWVTNIYFRRDAHLLTDLAYHSVLHLPPFIPGGRPAKGWVEVLLIGDTSQGKSDIVCGSQGDGGVRKFYSLGEKVVGKAASVPGLVGGLQTFNGRWIATWGKMPCQDRRLIIFEETKGADIAVISKLTDVRSSGIAQIDKIIQRKAFARNRFIWISNCRDEKMMSQYAYGIVAILDLFGALEDVRRLDAAMTFDSSQIDPQALKERQSMLPVGTQKFSAELCRSLILWAWTRTPQQIIISSEIREALANAAVRFNRKYTGSIPLVDVGSMAGKLTRLATSLACRTYSADGEKVVVRLCHVEYIEEFLYRLYDSPTMGYIPFTVADRLTSQVEDEDKVVAKINTLPYPGDWVKAMLHNPTCDIVAFMDWSNWERNDASEFISFLLRKHALKREKNYYIKTPPFIRLLKRMLDTPDLLQDRPEYMRKDAM